MRLDSTLKQYLKRAFCGVVLGLALYAIGFAFGNPQFVALGDTLLAIAADLIFFAGLE